MTNRNPVVIESPLAGCFALNRAYLNACVRDTLERGETQYASHKMLDGPLDDLVPEQREQGILAGLAMRDILVERAGATVVYYVDLGWSSGMKRALLSPNGARRFVERTLDASAAWERIYAEAIRADAMFLEVSSEMPLIGQSHREHCIAARDRYLVVRAKLGAEP